MPLNSQATSSPYEADNLRPHDENLVYTVEYGTNATTEADLGDAFNSFPAGDPPQPVASMNARYGMLQVDAFNQVAFQQDTLPRGQTWPFDPTVLFPFQPAIEIGLGVIYAHILVREESNIEGPSPSDETGCGLFLGGVDMIGDNPDAPFVFPQIKMPANFGAIRPSARSTLDGYPSGGGGLPLVGEGAAMDSDIYLRLAVTHSPEKPDSLNIATMVSNKGLSWRSIDAGFSIDLPEGFKRLGFGTRGPVIGLLDWVRAYNVPLGDPPVNSFTILPGFPVTGGRLFTP